MRTLAKSMMALLIVSSAIAAKSADSVEMSTVCKIIAGKKDHYKVIYQANDKQPVSIKLYDDKQQIVYSEDLKSAGFIKQFDLTNLPFGSYQIKVLSNDRVFEEKLRLGENPSDFNLKLTPKSPREISFVASNDQGMAMTLYILNDSREIIYTEKFNDTKQIHKKYNFDKLFSNEVSFMFYHDDQLLAEENFDF